MTIELPAQFTFSVEQVAALCGCSGQTIRRNILREVTDRYYLKARKNDLNGPYVIAASDFVDYLKRTQVGAEIRTSEAA